MSIQITHWLRAFLALQEAAYDGRGEVSILDGNEVVERWPRTTGNDAIAIAAVIDPFARAHTRDCAEAYWRPLAADLEAFAIADGADVYRQNKTFWRALLVTCVELHGAAAPLPPSAQLEAMLAQLLATPVVSCRNGVLPPSGPFKNFEGVKTFDELYNAEFVYLRDLRGSDELQPNAGTADGSRTIPRTTNGDVVSLADFWSTQFQDSTEPDAIAGTRAPVANRWSAALVEVERVRTADPNAIFPGNNGFWRALREVALYIATAASAPSKWDLAKAAIKESVTHLPQNLEASAGAVAKFVGGVAHEVGKVANEAGKGLFAGFGTPILIGAGLLGLFLVTRKHGDDKKAEV